MNWTEYFLNIAETVKLKSKDRQALIYKHFQGSTVYNPDIKDLYSREGIIFNKTDVSRDLTDIGQRIEPGKYKILKKSTKAIITEKEDQI